MTKVNNQSKSSKNKKNYKKRAKMKDYAKEKKSSEKNKNESSILKCKTYWIEGTYLKKEGEKLPKVVRRANSQHAKVNGKFKMPLTKDEMKILDKYNITYTLATCSATKRKAKT